MLNTRDAGREFAAARRAGRRVLREDAGKRVLAGIGIAVPKGAVLEPGGIVGNALAGLAPPYAVKLVAPEISHKSDVGGVALNLATPDAVAAAIDRMAASCRARALAVEGFLIEEMAPAGHEIVVGGVVDPRFGPLVMVGLGGVFVEVFADIAFRACPIGERDAHQMIEDLRAAPVLAGLRGGPAASRDALVAVLLGIGGADGLLPRHEDDLAEIDVNPLIVSATGAVAVDARFVLREA